MITARRFVPTDMSATEFADHLAEQAAPLRALFHSGCPETLTGSRVVYERTMDIVRALRAGEIAPVVAQVRLIAVNRRAAFYHVRTISSRRPA
ncbi:hypothetical protein ACIRPQ_29405 [Streptomyces sp. NPDC101213]|uniref:hypothetical protein n=1 Tax=Streptomyces sp. NPDC101213 TaxID=3366130 RepID=UPI003803CDD1